jgi:hypothetical protein
MSFVGNLVGNVLGGVTGAKQQAEAAEQASVTQANAAQAGIDQQKAMFEAFQKALAPYVAAGTGALGAQQNLIGLNGNDAQQSAISAIQASPQFTALQKQGEDAILANASATGGLRGGNVQGALAQFSPALLSQLIQQQLGSYGDLASMGGNAAAGVGNAGLQTGSNVANLLQQQGAATAGGQLALGNEAHQAFVDGGKIASTIASFYGMGKGANWGGSGGTSQMTSAGQF